MTNPYRAMCAELVAALAEWRLGGGPPEDTADADLIARARALLDQPVAEGPSDEEIEEWADACPDAPVEEMDPEIHGWRRCFTAKEFSETIRAAIARWGHPTSQPEPEAPTDEEMMKLMPQQMVYDLAGAARGLTGPSSAMIDFEAYGAGPVGPHFSDMPWPDNPKAAVAMRIILNRHAVDHARAVLAKWGHQ